MKKVFCLLMILLSIEIYAQDSIPKMSIFFNVGRSSLLGNRGGWVDSLQPHEAIDELQMFNAYNLGGYVFLNNVVGLSGGISSLKFKLDKSTFETKNADDMLYVDSYLGTFSVVRLYVGFTKIFLYKKIIVKPRINLEYTYLDGGYSDFYQKNSQGEIYKTINYNLHSSGKLSYSVGGTVSYRLFDYGGVRFALQLLTEVSFGFPEIHYDRIESNKYTKFIDRSSESINQDDPMFYTGIGLVFGIGVVDVLK